MKFWRLLGVGKRSENKRGGMPENNQGEMLERFLALIYVDDEARSRFLEDRRVAALEAGLNETDADALEKIDLAGLELAAESFRRKRERGSRS